jgi:hypothetical protein
VWASGTGCRRQPELSALPLLARLTGDIPQPGRRLSRECEGICSLSALPRQDRGLSVDVREDLGWSWKVSLIDHRPVLRLMIPLSGPRQAVGHIGFHSPPDGEGRVEVGYTVFPAYRRLWGSRPRPAGL